MKKLLFSLLSFLLVVGVAIGQEAPDKAQKKAARAMTSYDMDPVGNAAKLEEAKEMIDIAAADATVGADIKTWQTKGNIYAAYLQKDMNQLVINPTHKVEHAAEGLMALQAYEKALGMAQKKFETKDALKGMEEVTKSLNFVGNSQIQAKEYAEAYKTLSSVMDANIKIKEAGGDPPIAAEEMNNLKFIVAFCAEVAGEKEVSNKYFKELYDSGFEDPGVYSKYFNVLVEEGKMEEALKVLETGRAKFPDDTEILFAEINYYIQKEQYDVLESKLKEAVEKEPENASIRSALGNVYMNLHEAEFTANGETEKGKKYFDSALDYFNQAVSMNAEQLDAIYSIGSLYYNQAVAYLKLQSKLDLKEQKKYDEYSVKIKGLFEKALPYFKDAERIDPNDINTLVALSEIYARTNEFELSKEFKSRLEKVQAGEKITEPYFKK